MNPIKTLDDIITMDDRYDINKITFFGMSEDGTLVLPETDLMQIYGRYIAPYVVSLKVTPSQRQYYRFKPYLLSLDVYDTPNLGWLILRMNDKESASGFHLKETIRLIPQSILDKAYDQIATRSTERLSANWNTYYRIIGSEIN